MQSTFVGLVIAINMMCYMSLMVGPYIGREPRSILILNAFFLRLITS